MKSARMTTMLAAAALTITLTGCGEDDEPSVENPPAAEETSATQAPEAAPTTQAPAEPSEAAPTSEDAPSEPADPTDGGGEGDLPTDPTAYADLFVQAWADQDQAVLEQLAAEDVLESMESWEGQGWARGEVRQETHGAVVIEYADQEQMVVELWVQEGITQAGEPHGIVSASVSEGSLPPPDTIEDYASAFVEAAAGDAAQRAIVEQLGTPEAAAEAQDWIGDYNWGEPTVSDGDDAGTARVTFTSDDGVELVLMLDRELVESASEDGVLSAQRDGGDQPELSIREYADEFVLAFGEGDAETMRKYATDEVVDELRDAGGPGWAHVHSGENGGVPVEVYEDASSGRELALTLDADLVAAGEDQAITAADLAVVE